MNETTPSLEFDEAWYLQANLDVLAAVKSGALGSAREHFERFGKKEGRLPCAPSETALDDETLAPGFDEDWYLTSYPDIREAVNAGFYPSAVAHYIRHGKAEGRPFSAASDLAQGLASGDREDRVGALWSVDGAAKPGWYWVAHPMVQARLNTLASGRPDRDSYGRLVDILIERGTPVPIPRAVSLGCGFGYLERDLFARGIIQEADAYDIAPGAIAEACRLTAAAGMDGLRFHVADLETEPVAHGDVDVVFAHQSVHHVERLERLFEAVAAMLRPGGIFHLHEFVGPIRFQWTDTQIDLVNRFLDGLPPRLRALPDGRPRPRQLRPTIGAMITADPSEAVRSSDILPVLHRYFDIVEERPIGGTLLHLGLADIAQNFDENSADDRAILEDFFRMEDHAMRDGIVGSDFTVVTAAKR